MVELEASLRESLQAQAKVELQASLLYLQAHYWFSDKHLKGIAAHFLKESDEERTHFKQMLDYLDLRGALAKVEPPSMPELNWANETEVFEYFLDLERRNTENINGLYKKAREAGDYDFERFMLTFVEHQVKSVDEWEALVEKVKSFNAMPGLIWHLDAII